MRKIKFRAWDGYCMMRNLDSVTLAELKEGLYTEDGETLLPCEYMQFTGLQDKNGKDIYEGDIVQFTYWWFDGNEAESNLTGIIVYDDQLMSFQLKDVKNKEWEDFTGNRGDEYLTPFSELTFCNADFGVISNIYENPELLNPHEDK